MEKEIQPYINGDKKNVSYEDMGLIYKLPSEQVRIIAIERAKLRKKNNDELVTIEQNTKGELVQVSLDVNVPKKITISDSDVSHGLRQTLAYNFRQIKTFEKKYPDLFDGKNGLKSKECGVEFINLFNTLYTSDIYGQESIDSVIALQKALGFNGDNLDGKFGPNTQKELLKKLNITEKTTPPVAPASPQAQTPAPQANTGKVILDPDAQAQVI